MRCTAKSKRTGERCRRSAAPGRRVCVMHGGRAKVGVANPAFTDGHRSRYLPARYHAAFTAAEEDARLLSLSRDLAEVEARLVELHQRLDSGETGQAWARLKANWQAYTAATTAEEYDRAAELFAEHGRILAEARDETAWREILELIERRRRLVETETRIAAQSEIQLRADELRVLMVQLGHVLREHVRDRALLAAITTDFARLTGPVVAG